MLVPITISPSNDLKNGFIKKENDYFAHNVLQVTSYLAYVLNGGEINSNSKSMKGNFTLLVVFTVDLFHCFLRSIIATSFQKTMSNRVK